MPARGYLALLYNTVLGESNTALSSKVALISDDHLFMWKLR